MPRSWFAIALIIIPCLALAGWAGWHLLLGIRIDESGQRAIYRDLATAQAREAMERELAAVRALLTAAAQATTAQAGEEALAACVDGALVTAATVALDLDHDPGPADGPAPLLADDAGLRAARYAEFVSGDLDAARTAYDRCLATATDPAIRAEAWAGAVGVRQVAGDGDGAARMLARWLQDDPPPRFEALAGAALALDRDGRLPPTVLFAVWRTLHQARAMTASPLVEAIDRSMAERSAGLDASRLADYRRATRTLTVVRDGRERWRSAPEEVRDRVLEGATGVWIPWDGQAVLALPAAWVPAARPGDRPPGDATGRVLLVIDASALAARCAAALAGSPVLTALARSHRARFAGDVRLEATVDVNAPWAGRLAVDLPPAAEAGAAPRHGAVAMSWLLLAGAVAAVSGGCVALALAARRDARSARLKSDFVSNVSHELKTPLSLVRLYGEMLLSGYASGDDARQRAQRIIVDEAQRLGLLIENVLDLGRMERGERAYRFAPVDVAALVRRTVDAYRAHLDHEGFTLDLDLEDGLPEVRGDEHALTQVLLNLLSNAMKFSIRAGDGGDESRGESDRGEDTGGSRNDRRIAIALARAGTHLRLGVADHGIGIPAAEHERIFAPFYRVETGLARHTRGSGIGLALVRHAVQAHGGTIAVASRPGHGATFAILLPIADPPEASP